MLKSILFNFAKAIFILSITLSVQINMAAFIAQIQPENSFDTNWWLSLPFALSVSALLIHFIWKN